MLCCTAAEDMFRSTLSQLSTKPFVVGAAFTCSESHTHVFCPSVRRSVEGATQQRNVSAASWDSSVEAAGGNECDVVVAGKQQSEQRRRLLTEVEVLSLRLLLLLLLLM